jgi:uncharacterized membrane protein YfcA
LLPLHQTLILFLAAVAAGIINAVAGGGGFFSFPTLVFMGVPPVNANASGTVALWPGTLASTGAYWSELKDDLRKVWPLAITSALGGLLGAILLLKTPQLTFLRMVPWLMLAATILFAFAKRITAWVQKEERRPHGRVVLIGATILQLIVAVYIGYFGAGAGIVILAMLAIMGVEDIHSMNGLKTLLASCANGVAVVTFIVARTVWWPYTLVMLVGAVLGGYGGAWYAQRLTPGLVRGFVIATGLVMTAYFFWKVW